MQSPRFGRLAGRLLRAPAVRLYHEQALFNFLPSTAVNSTEMWQADSFDAATIERELRTTAGARAEPAPQAVRSARR